MTLASCPECGTQVTAGELCPVCGTLTPTPTPPAPSSGPPPAPSGESGFRHQWEAIQENLEQATAPKYRIRRILGYGGMAGVFLADEPRLGRQVAIKVMAPAMMVDPSLVERFGQEARTIAQLNHPNIVTIFEVDDREGLHYFTMTFVDGRTLGEVLAEATEPLPISVVRALLYQVGDALGYAHQRGVVHRDVKPGNVLLDPRGSVLVTDFGIAKIADSDSGLTRTGMLVGTPAYMSPEQCSSTSVTGTSDQYSLGVMVYQMLTGRPPFSGSTFAVLHAHVTQEPPPLRDLRPDCPDDLASAVERMLRKGPEERWPTVSAAVAAAGATAPELEGPVRDQLKTLAVRAAGISVAPRIERLREGSREPMEAIVFDAQGHALPARRIEWSSRDEAVVSVLEATLSAMAPGETEIEVRCGSARTTFALTIDEDPVASVGLESESLSGEPGERLSLRAVVSDWDGTPIEDRVVRWSSSDPAVVVAHLDGTIECVGEGRAIVTASTGGKWANVRVAVGEQAIAEAAAEAARPAPPATSEARSLPDATPRPEAPEADTGESPLPADSPPHREAPEPTTGESRPPTDSPPHREAREPTTGESHPPTDPPVPRREAREPTTGESRPSTDAPPRRKAPERAADPAAGAAKPGPRAVPATPERGGRPPRTALVRAGVAGGIVVAVLLLWRPWRSSRPEPTPNRPIPAQAGNTTPPAGSGAADSLAGTPPASRRESAAAASTTPESTAVATRRADSVRRASSAAGSRGRTPPANGGGATGSGVTRSAPAATPPEPAAGTIRIEGTLPPGAAIEVRTPDGAIRVVRDRSITLPPGSYLLRFAAPGYEVDQDTIRVSSGQTTQWAPTVTALQPAATAPAQPGATTTSATSARAAADVAAIDAAVQRWGKAFNDRDAGTVVPLMPAANRPTWQAMLTNRAAVTDFHASVDSVGTPLVNGDNATVAFSITVAFRSGNAPQRQTLSYVAKARRAGSGWELLSLEKR